MGRWRLFASAGLAGMLAAGALGARGAETASGTTFVNWPQYLYSPAHSSADTAATAITPANAGSLKLAWHFSPAKAPISGLSGFLSSPVVYNGVIYIGAKNGYFYALNETTGAVIWQRFIGYVPKLTCGAQGFTSTATVAPDPATGNPTVYVYGATGYLYAMNTADGTDVWPPAAVAIPSTTVNDYYAWSSPLVTGGNIYVGISSQCDVPLVRGALDEFSQASGALENTFWTTPPDTVGASIWSSPATDGQSVYVTTGNGDAGSDGFSVIQLDPSLNQQAIWTVPQNQLVSDSDFGGSPGLWTASLGWVRPTRTARSTPSRPPRCRPARCGSGRSPTAARTSRRRCSTARTCSWPASTPRSWASSTRARCARSTRRPAGSSGRPACPGRSSARRAWTGPG
jgi:outer membrane protein assembly factor BamB